VVGFEVSISVLVHVTTPSSLYSSPFSSSLCPNSSLPLLYPPPSCSLVCRSLLSLYPPPSSSLYPSSSSAFPPRRCVTPYFVVVVAPSPSSSCCFPSLSWVRCPARVANGPHLLGLRGWGICWGYPAIAKSFALTLGPPLHRRICRHCRIHGCCQIRRRC